LKEQSLYQVGGLKGLVGKLSEMEKNPLNFCIDAIAIDPPAVVSVAPEQLKKRHNSCGAIN
jgi:hypothetical protein